MSKKNRTFEEFNEILHDDGNFTKKLPVGKGHKYALLSDLHLGNKNNADNFKHNEDVLLEALDYYYERGYSIILIGDIEERYQFAIHEIVGQYPDVYLKFKSFEPGRVHRVYGNHDSEWGLEDPILNAQDQLRFAYEAVKLGDHIMVTHGHQGEKVSGENQWIAKFFVRFYRPFEDVLGSVGMTSKYSHVAHVPGKKDQYYYEWAKEKQKILICGHTHNAVSASRSVLDWVSHKLHYLENEIEKASSGGQGGNPEKIGELTTLRDWYRGRYDFAVTRHERFNLDGCYFEEDPLPCYFNTGCGIYAEGITNIEIEDHKIRLVYWNNGSHERDKIWYDEDLNDIVNRVKGTSGVTYI